MEEVYETEREKIILERILTLKQMLQDGDGGPLELHELGICYYYIENYRQAAEYLGKLAHEYPDYLEFGAAQTLRVLCLIQEQELDVAEKIIHDRLELYGDDTKLLGMLAHIQESKKKFPEAIKTHRKILRLDPENLNSLNNLGYLLTLHGEKSEQEEAYVCLKKAIAKKPDHAAYLDSFGVFLGKAGKTESARKALGKALRQQPESSIILEHLQKLSVHE